MRGTVRRGLLGMSGHRLVPLVIMLLALGAIGFRYLDQMHHIAADVVQIESQRLRDRLGVEQTRLDIPLGTGDQMALRRIVSALGLHDGLNNAYLIDQQGRVQASLSRADIGATLEQALARVEHRELISGLFQGPAPAAIDIAAVEDQPLITGWVPLLEGRRLGVLVDVAIPLAQRRQTTLQSLAVEAVAALVVAGLFAMLLHLLWFRRAVRLAGALESMGAGDLSVRTGLDGRDELALIGRAADHMAEQLQADRAVALHMSDLVNRSPLVVIEWRNAPGWPVSYVSDSVSAWGYAPADLLQGRLRYNDLIHPQDVVAVNAELDTYFKHGPDVYRQEYRIRRADGGWAWVDDRTSLARNAAGEVDRISGVLLDITAQKEAELAQREQGELLRLFYELPFIGMAITSPKTKRWLQVNDRLCEILGYPREELLAMTWAEITPAEDLRRNFNLFDELVAGQRDGYTLEKRFVRKDGSLVETAIHVRAVRGIDGGLDRLFTTVQDVSERHRYEQNLQRMQDQLLKAQRIGNMGSWSQDLRSGRFFWSPQTHVIHGTDPQQIELTLESILGLLHPDDLERVRAAYAESVRQGLPYDIRYRILQPDGGVRHLHVRGEFELEDGRPVRSVGMALDETALVEAQRERDRLVSVLEATTDIVSMADAQGQVFYFNRAGYEMLGLPPETPLVDVIRRVHPQWAGQRVREEGIPHATAHGSWLGETAVYDADGRERPMSQLIIAHRGPDGKLTFLSAILRDISERKAAELALRQQQDQLAEAQALAHVGNWEIDLVTRTTHWSDELFRIFGHAPGAVEPGVENFLRLVHPDEVARVRERLGQAMHSPPNGSYHFEHRIVTSAGVRFVEQRGRVHFNESGQAQRVFGTTMDVTERTLAAQAVVDLADMLEQAETVSLLGSWAGDAQTQRLKVSAQLFRNLGLEPAPRPPTDAQYLDRIHPEDRPQVVADMQRIREGGPPDDFVFRTNPLHGPLRWMRRTARRILRDEEGLKPRYIGTLLDITESVRAEEKLRLANQDLERRVAERTAQLSQANQELEAFSYTVSHDLKAPLRGIDGYSQLLVEEYGAKLDEEGRQFVRRIRQGVQQMGDLISDLLEYSRMERRDMAADPLDVKTLVDLVLEGYRADIERQGAEVRVEMSSFTLPLDREGIQVVLRNLIGNALKFSRDSRPPVLQIGSRLEAGRRVIWVRDNGVGFDMKYHDRMFGIFQRLHRVEEFPGTGVGLALVAKAVQRMGGRVWAESSPGAGATFYLEFPE